MTKLILQLIKIDACYEARAWVRAGEYRTLAAAWADCPRGDWMLWYAGILSGGSESAARKQLVLAACACARLALPSAQSPTVEVCLETVENWANGKASLGEVRKARAACVGASGDTCYAFSESGADYSARASAAAILDFATAIAVVPITVADRAASIASCAPYAVVTSASTRGLTLARCADIVREHYPEPPTGE